MDPKLALIIAAAAILGCATQVRCADAPLIGFVNHYPFIVKDMEQIPASGSNAVIFRAVAAIPKEDGTYDFTTVDQQIEYAEKHNVRIVLLLEANPLYTPAWLRKKCIEAGEIQMTVDGGPDVAASMTSGIFKAWHEGFVKALIEHVKERDKQRVVVGYQPGAEWWYHAHLRYNKADLAAFRKWLKSKYGSVSALNSTWESDYKSFDEAEPSRLVIERSMGNDKALSTFVPRETLGNALWRTRELLPVTPGREYVMNVRMRTKNVRGDGGFFMVRWRNAVDGHEENSITNTTPHIQGTSAWQEYSISTKAPQWASQASLILCFYGTGRVDFDEVSLIDKESGSNIAPNPTFEQGGSTPDAYVFEIAGEKGGVKGEYLSENGGRYVSTQVARSVPDRRFKNWQAVAYDWSMFSYEFFGDYIEGFCKLVKDVDPSRPTIGYLTWSFAFPVEWDGVEFSAMALDVILPKLKHLDMLGMQIVAADGDPMRVTAAIDLARKYGKRMLPIDLLDFTSGTRIGYPVMDAVTQCAVQHGATGAFYYCWWGTPDYDFYTGMELSDLNKMLTHGLSSMERIMDAKTVSRVAVIQPILPAVFTDPNGSKNDFRDFAGLYKAVLDAQMCPDIWTVNELSAQRPDLRARYDVVFLPDCAYCPSRAVEVLRKFVAKGGQIVCSGRLPAFDEIGATLPATAFGPELRNAIALSPDFGKVYLGGFLRTTNAGANTPALFVETDDPAEMLVRRTKMVEELSRALEQTPLNRQCRIDAPGVGCTVFSRGDTELFFITNRSKLTALKDVQIRPGEGYAFEGVSGGEVSNLKQENGSFTLDLGLTSSSAILTFAKR